MRAGAWRWLGLWAPGVVGPARRLGGRAALPASASQARGPLRPLRPPCLYLAVGQSLLGGPPPSSSAAPACPSPSSAWQWGAGHGGCPLPTSETGEPDGQHCPVPPLRALPGVGAGGSALTEPVRPGLGSPPPCCFSPLKPGLTTSSSQPWSYLGNVDDSENLEGHGPRPPLPLPSHMPAPELPSSVNAWVPCLLRPCPVASQPPTQGSAGPAGLSPGSPACLPVGGRAHLGLTWFCPVVLSPSLPDAARGLQTPEKSRRPNRTATTLGAGSGLLSQESCPRSGKCQGLHWTLSRMQPTGKGKWQQKQTEDKNGPVGPGLVCFSYGREATGMRTICTQKCWRPGCSSYASSPTTTGAGQGLAPCCGRAAGRGRGGATGGAPTLICHSPRPASLGCVLN